MRENIKIKRSKTLSKDLFTYSIAFFFAWIVYPFKASAEGWKLETGLGIGSLKSGSEITLSDYVVGIYNVAAGMVGIVGVLMFMIGGFQYMIASGKRDMASEAKRSMINAIIGIALVLTARIVLGTINKELIDLQNINLGGGNQ